MQIIIVLTYVFMNLIKLIKMELVVKLIVVNLKKEMNIMINIV